MNFVSCSSNQFFCDGKCKNNHFKCDFKQDCRDGRDESSECILNNNSTCDELIKEAETKKCHVKYSSLGTLISKIHLPLKTLENCKKNELCDIGYFKCRKVFFCMSIEQVCDGIEHCPFGDDEIDCGKMNDSKVM